MVISNERCNEMIISLKADKQGLFNQISLNRFGHNGLRKNFNGLLIIKKKKKKGRWVRTTHSLIHFKKIKNTRKNNGLFYRNSKKGKFKKYLKFNFRRKIYTIYYAQIKPKK